MDLRYIENHDLERFISQFGFSSTKLAAALLFTIPGSPLVYFGQETGLTEQRAQMNWNEPHEKLFDFYKKLILLRRHHLCFRRGDMIRVHNNFDKQVLSYIRQTEDETFLVILNFGKEIRSCQFLLPNELTHHLSLFELKLENVLNQNQFTTRIFQNQQMKLKLDEECPHIYRLILHNK